MNGPRPDLYAVLQVERTASQEEIRRAYRRLMRSFHPDLQPQPGEGEPAPVADLHAVMKAYEVLGDPARRAAYDRATAPKPPRRAPSDPLLPDRPPVQAGDTVWIFPPRQTRHDPLPDLRQLLEYLLRGRFPW
ncbi:J domain-containing protein [Arthrobacter mobilis]|uniref:J domain-containing protein n=1 Tax=Arthrobacter mobilis TaxID=2724944 RepID=A0A7X6HBQ3_9MICC|nr:J domain-containing protein [Arthrobacter mobilis]NKX54147.1 J domain-containing protein [Arthrobacter mobilis]